MQQQSTPCGILQVLHAAAREMQPGGRGHGSENGLPGGFRPIQHDPAAGKKPGNDVAFIANARQRISLRAERLTYVVGFVFLFAFLIWVTGFDIARSLGGATTP